MSTTYISEPATRGKVIMHTTKGPLDIELWSKEAVLTTRNFIQHALNGYYDNCRFHRLVPGFILQGGDPTETGHGGEPSGSQVVPVETHQRLTFNRRGLMGMADGQSQFFFTLDKAVELNGKHTVFGRVVGNTVYNLIDMTSALTADVNERPSGQITITSIDVVDNPFDDLVPRVIQQQIVPPVVLAKKPNKRTRTLLSFDDDPDGGVAIHKSQPARKKPTIPGEITARVPDKKKPAIPGETTARVPSSASSAKPLHKSQPAKKKPPGEPTARDPDPSSPAVTANPAEPSTVRAKRKKPGAIDQWSKERARYQAKSHSFNPNLTSQLNAFKTKLASLPTKESDGSGDDDGWLSHALKFRDSTNEDLDLYMVIDPRDHKLQAHANPGLDNVPRRAGNPFSSTKPL